MTGEFEEGVLVRLSLPLLALEITLNAFMSLRLRTSAQSTASFYPASSASRRMPPTAPGHTKSFGRRWPTI